MTYATVLKRKEKQKMSLRYDFDDDYCNAYHEQQKELSHVCGNPDDYDYVSHEERERRQKLKRLYICEISREDLYDLYLTVCFELRLAHRSLKKCEKHLSSESIFENIFRTVDAKSQVAAITWIYRSLKSALPRSVWFAFKRRYKRERKER